MSIPKVVLLRTWRKNVVSILKSRDKYQMSVSYMKFNIPYHKKSSKPIHLIQSQAYMSVSVWNYQWDRWGTEVVWVNSDVRQGIICIQANPISSLLRLPAASVNMKQGVFTGKHQVNSNCFLVLVEENVIFCCFREYERHFSWSTR